ncbi:helicase-exonuclease AddAB subunit AddA [Clostridiaceae bacterium HFYG-1003]|nr:helicase-exonuclease AddAB subunit AddA [Clostridiaceae bacterium HFYG-1003]
MPNWTNEQQQAIIYRDQSLLVAAAAGSGKTAVLVERICTMLTQDPPVDIDRLLVVTFTRAAATEMRERIANRIALALESQPENENLLRQLALLNQASIMTIDAFCKKVIEENFHLVDLDPDYQLLDENELNMLISEALAEVLEEAYEKRDPAFLELAERFGGDRSDDNLEDLIQRLWRFSRSGTDPRAWIRAAGASYDFPKEDWKQTEWFRYLVREVREVAGEAVELAQKAVGLTALDDKLAASKLEPFLRGELEELVRIAREVEQSDDYAQLQSLMKSMTFARKPAIRGETPYKDWVGSLRDEYKKLYTSLIGELLSQDEASHLTLIRTMAPVMNALAEVTLAFHERLQSKKRELNRVDFADLEHFALGILRSGDGPTETARIYQQRFEEVLIDEYQDSNEVQEAILTAVSRQEQNIFMVGDVKQSIYRFRQAKPDIFLGKYRRFLAVGEERDCAGRKILLYRNFRSRPEVLDSVNAVFSAIMSERAGELDYTEEEALIFGAAYDPEQKQPIQIHLVESNTPLDGPAQEAEELEDLAGIELEARYVANRIRDMVTSGETRVTDGETMRPLRYRDIVILLRATSSAAGIFQQALEEVAIPVFTDTGAGYFESLEIRTMMSLLRTVDNPRQDIPLLATLRSPLFSFTEDELLRLRGLDREALFLDCLKLARTDVLLARQAPELCRKVEAFWQQLAQWREDSVHRPLDEFIWKIYTDTAYLEYAGAMPNGIQRQANLRILFQRAGEYEKTAFKGLYRFIRYIDAMREKSGDYGDARIMGESEDVVRIMSIHKSKGLEFPVVFVSNCGKRFNRRDQGGDLILHETLGMAVKHRDFRRGTVEETLPRLVMKARINAEAISEEMRVLYVAMTRAKEQLILTGNLRNLNSTMGKWFRGGSDLPCRPRKVLADSSYLDWIMPVVLNSAGIQGAMETFDDTVDHLGDGASFDITLITRNALAQAQAEQARERTEPFWKGEALTDEALIRVLDYEYPHELSTRLPSKVSVSVIKKQVIEETPDLAAPSIMEETYERVERLPKPAFLMGQRELTGAERGTAFHNVMLHISPLVQTEEEVRVQIQSVVERELLLPQEAAAVDPRRVLGFFQSSLGQRFREAFQRGDLYKEEVFTRIVPARTLRPEWATDDPMTLIGIIDAFFREGDGLILLDYKTDSIPPDVPDFLARKYQAQIDLYARALEAITGQTVREAYLYSVSKQETIRLI